ncbi:MAG: hypothetical protein ACKOD2_03230, partial [Ilumatobacteraceae bacterium]
MPESSELPMSSAHRGGVDAEAIARIARDLAADAQRSVGHVPSGAEVLPAPGVPASMPSHSTPPRDVGREGTSSPDTAIKEFVRRIRRLDHRSLPDLPAAFAPERAVRPATLRTAFDVESVRNDFPIL